MATVVTYAGLDIITNRIKAAGTEPNFLAWGTGTHTAAQTDTALTTESSESRVTGTSTRQTTSQANDTYQVVGTMTAGGSRSIKEAGLFDASTSGHMFTSADFATVTLATSDSIAFTWKVQFS